MAAPVDSRVRLPDDSGNTGKYIQTKYRSLGGFDVHAHAFFPISPRSLLGRYVGHSGNLTVSATVHTFGTSGFLWAHLPSAATSKVAINKIVVETQMTTALVAVTSPRLMWSTFTFTGTASGASVTSGKKRSGDAAARFSIRTAITGLTIAKVADIIAVLPVSSATAVAYSAPAYWYFQAQDEDDEIELLPGEGLCLWQADAGTTSDTRKIVSQIHWKEFE